MIKAKAGIGMYPVENDPSSRNYRREISGNIIVSRPEIIPIVNKLRAVILLIFPALPI